MLEVRRMKKCRIIVIRKKTIFMSIMTIVLMFSIFHLVFSYAGLPVHISANAHRTVIFIDPGHGGVDGGANKDGIMEKDINLTIAIKLKTILEKKGFQVILSREKDISLDNLDASSQSRHRRDLNARVNAINNSGAALYLSIHVNNNPKKPSASGSIVFYNDKLPENKMIADSIQQSLNSISVKGEKRTIHDPQSSNFYLVRNAKVPGVLVETAFLSNDEERKLLLDDAFCEQLAEALAKGVKAYLNDSDRSISSAKLAIIIDDIGSSDSGFKRMLEIDEHLTFAVMPFLENSERDAVKAYEKGFEVIAHLPMEANGGKKSWVGPKPILSGMTSDEVKAITAEAIDSIPYVVGANIHMGSKASSKSDIMSAILEVLKERNLYFVDSRTTEHPIGKKIADEHDVLCYDRDVFLDGQQPKSFVKKRLRQAGDVALKRGYAVAIGHAGIEGGDVTAEAIMEMIPEFKEKKIQLVFVSELDVQ
jgi:N-acetylmuramoyl-L-alanine amidase CwlD